MTKTVKNYGKSVRTRLLNLSKEEGIPFMTLLVRYLQERLLYRVSQSTFHDNLYLKGGALLYAHQQEKSRPTKDIDFLGRHINNDSDFVKSVFCKIVSIPCETDGVVFDGEHIEAVNITEDKEYHGVRLTILAALDTIRQKISIDIGFGDVVVPMPQSLDYPVLLKDVPKVSVLAYSLETVVAEKFEAMISLSVDNSRMKDFFDVSRILTTGDVNPLLLQEAITHTFKNRGTVYKENHPLFEAAFYENEKRQIQWRAFLRNIKWTDPVTLGEVGTVIIEGLMPYWRKLK